MITFISKTPVTFTNIQKAFLHVARIHPLLRATIETDGKRPWFNFKDDVSVDVEELKTSDWGTVCRQIQEDGFSDTSKLWHVKMLAVAQDETTDPDYPHHCKLILTMDHSIGDGSSVVAVIKGVYDYIEADLSGTIIQDPVSLPIPPTAEQLMHIRYIPIYHSLVKLAGIIPRLILKIKTKNNDNRRQTSFIKQIIEQEMKKPTFGRKGLNTITTFFTQEQTSLLLRACKHHKVSPMTTLMAGFFLTVADHLPIRDVKDAAYQITFAFQNKGKTNDRVASYGRALTNLWPDFQNRGTFWETADECQQGVHESIVKRQTDQLRQINKIPIFLPESDAELSPMETLVCVNNYGKVVFSDKNNPFIKIVNLHGSVDGGIMVPLHICIGYREGKIYWWLNHRNDVVSEETAQEMVKSLNDIVMKNT